MVWLRYYISIFPTGLYLTPALLELTSHLQDQLVWLYAPKPSLLAQIPAFYNINLARNQPASLGFFLIISVVPLNILSIVNSSIALGLQGLVFRLCVDVAKSILAGGLNVYFFEYHGYLGLTATVYAGLIAMAGISLSPSPGESDISWVSSLNLFSRKPQNTYL